MNEMNEVEKRAEARRRLRRMTAEELGNLFQRLENIEQICAIFDYFENNDDMDALLELTDEGPSEADAELQRREQNAAWRASHVGI